MDRRGIAIFDSGLGGLTVVRAIQQLLPAEELIYFGDTARVPYGSKSKETVTRFAREICEFLLRFDPKLVVFACNTASASALPSLRATLTVPSVGVVVPGARAAVEQAAGGTIAVIATESTINSDAYRTAMRGIDPQVRVIQKPCPLFVPLAEEGRPADDPIVQAVVRDYLQPIIALGPRVLVLGCTHYPLLSAAIADAVGPDVRLIDSGEQTALQVRRLLQESDGLQNNPARGRLTCYVSDNPQRFRELGQRFLKQTIVDVTWVAPERFHADEIRPTG